MKYDKNGLPIKEFYTEELKTPFEKKQFQWNVSDKEGIKYRIIGKIEGKISNVKKGTNGFGYDPIFIPKNKKITFGEMRPLEKYNIDHRKQAYKKIRKFF